MMNLPKYWLIDMDGVLWRGATALPGLGDFFAALRQASCGLRLITNNATRTPAQYVEKLAGLGVAVQAEEVLTSSLGTALWLARQHPGAAVYMVGEGGLREPLLDNGLHLVEDGAEFVVVGLDRQFTYQKLDAGLRNLLNGARLIATNPDVTFPTEQGFSPGNGSLVAAFAAASGQTPLVIGKPEPTLYQLAMQQLKADPADTIAIGDRLDTDILGAHKAGIASILVLTGVTTAEQAAASDLQPTFTLPDLGAVLTHFGVQNHVN